MRADPAFVRRAHARTRPAGPRSSSTSIAARRPTSASPATGLGRTLRTLLAGEKVGSFEDGGERYDVRVQVLPEYRDDPSKIDLIRVRSRARRAGADHATSPPCACGEGPVADAARQPRALDPARTRTPRRASSLSDVLPKLAPLGRGDRHRSRPTRWCRPGRPSHGAEAARDIVFALGLAMVSIYMILASLFNSLTHPFTIMMSAPLSFIGGFLALKVAGMSLDMMSGIGLLVLMGLVMKNGILLVDYTNQLREPRACAATTRSCTPARCGCVRC